MRIFSTWEKKKISDLLQSAGEFVAEMSVKKYGS
jgi:hypothetical protein